MVIYQKLLINKYRIISLITILLIIFCYNSLLAQNSQTKKTELLTPPDNKIKNSALDNNEIKDNSNKVIKIDNLPIIDKPDIDKVSVANDIKNNNNKDQKPDTDKSINKTLEQEVEISKEDAKKEIGNIFNRKKIDSLMFSDIELRNINRALSSAQSGDKFIPEKDDKLSKLADKEKEKKEQEELAKKQAEEENRKREEEKDVSEKSYIYLASIMYYDPQDWVVWINDKKITTKNNIKKNELYIKKLNESQADIVWKLSVSKWKIISGKKSEESAPKINRDNQVEIYFTLKPNQTFMLVNNEVVEGRAVIGLINRKKEEEKKAVSKNIPTNPKDENSSQPASKPTEEIFGGDFGKDAFGGGSGN